MKDLITYFLFYKGLRFGYSPLWGVGGLFLFLFAFSACKKLPKETHKGKGTMACYVNGEKWVAKSKLWNGYSLGSPGGSTDPNPFAKKSDSDNTLDLWGSSKKENQGSLFISIKNFTGVGEYKLKKGSNYTSESYAEYFAYGTDSINTGTINIKYYTDKVVAGTFSFNAGKNTNTDVIKITEGRFDIEYSYK